MSNYTWPQVHPVTGITPNQRQLKINNNNKNVMKRKKKGNLVDVEMPDEL